MTWSFTRRECRRKKTRICVPAECTSWADRHVRSQLIVLLCTDMASGKEGQSSLLWPAIGRWGPDLGESADNHCQSPDQEWGCPEELSSGIANARRKNAAGSDGDEYARSTEAQRTRHLPVDRQWAVVALRRSGARRTAWSRAGSLYVSGAAADTQRTATMLIPEHRPLGLEGRRCEGRDQCELLRRRGK